MADERSLMRPLRADSLRPRPSTQAVWEPAPKPPAAEPEIAPPAQAPAVEETAVEIAPEPKPVEEAEPEWSAEVFLPDQDAQPLGDFIPTFAPEVRFEPQDRPEAEPEPQAPQEEEEPFDLDAVIAAILAEDDEDEDEAPAAQDALPTEEMPEPAFVPLQEAPAAKPRRKGWIWLIAAAAVTAATGCAARFLGWLR